MKEQVKNILEELGFQTEPVDEYLGFEFEGLNYLYLYNPNDEDFLNISIPCVMVPDEDDETMLFRIADKINSTLKYVKAYIYDDRLWLFYERELLGDEDLEKLITAMILRLAAAAVFVRQLSEGSDDDGCSSDFTEDDNDGMGQFADKNTIEE